MGRQIQGIALLLFSILLTLVFDILEFSHLFTLDFHWFYLAIDWVHLFLVIGIVGLLMVFWKVKED